MVKVTNKSMHPASFPLMEMPSIAFLLAVSAGLLNAWTFAHAKTFATVQSGNVIQVGYQLVAGDWPKFLFAAGMQGNGFHKIKGMLYGNVAVTLVVQLAFNYLMQAFFSKRAADGSSNLYNSGLYFLVLLGFAGGGAAGFGLDLLWSGLSVIGAMVVTLMLMGAAITDKADPDET